MKKIEVKQDITFYKDDKEKIYQRIKNGDIFKVKNGEISYKKIKQVNGYIIKYNTNGIYGFSIWKGNKNLEDRFWSLLEIEEVCKSM